MAKKFGDRSDAKRVKMPGLMQCCIDLKPTRMENEVYIDMKMDVTELAKYLDGKKEAGEKYTYFQAFVTAIAKVLYARPKFNRFVKNRHMYEHNDVIISFVAKVTLDDVSEELMMLLKVDPEDTMQTLSQKVADKIRTLRSQKTEKVTVTNAIDILCGLPNILRVPMFGLIKFADRTDLLPAKFRQDNIYFSSIIISNLGSIGCGAIYHNLANFGTCSSLASMGAAVDEEVIDENGNEQIRKLCEFGITLDERIGDGFYFAKSAKMIEYILQHPELLEEPVSQPFTMQA